MAEPATYQLEKTSDISKSEVMHEHLEAFLSKGVDVMIDASNVERIDTSAMQILIALSQTLRKQHLNASIVNPSESFLSAAKLLGIVDEIDILNSEKA